MMAGMFPDIDADEVFRVCVYPPRNNVSVMCFGFPDDNTLAGEYNSVHELPLWMQRRLAVLAIVPLPPPEQRVEGIGERISEGVYWVYGPQQGGTDEW